MVDRTDAVDIEEVPRRVVAAAAAAADRGYTLHSLIAGVPLRGYFEQEMSRELLHDRRR